MTDDMGEDRCLGAPAHGRTARWHVPASCLDQPVLLLLQPPPQCSSEHAAGGQPHPAQAQYSPGDNLSIPFPSDAFVTICLCQMGCQLALLMNITRSSVTPFSLSCHEALGTSLCGGRPQHDGQAVQTRSARGAGFSHAGCQQRQASPAHGL